MCQSTPNAISMAAHIPSPPTPPTHPFISCLPPFLLPWLLKGTARKGKWAPVKDGDGEVEPLSTFTAGTVEIYRYLYYTLLETEKLQE